MKLTKLMKQSFYCIILYLLLVVTLLTPREFRIFCIYIFDQKTVSLFTEEGISRKAYKFISVCYTLFSTLHYGKQLMKQALRSQM